MNENVSNYQGKLSAEEFAAVMGKTQYAPTTRVTLYDFLVRGTPMIDLPRVRRQFLRNKLVDLETRGLLK